jgi:transcriptional regulator with XRE-family HTH domain
MKANVAVKANAVASRAAPSRRLKSVAGKAVGAAAGAPKAPKAPKAAKAKAIKAAKATTATKATMKKEPAGWRRAQGDHSMTQELGVRVRAVREARGLSLAQLSEKSGIPGATLSRIENSKMSPTFGVLARVMMGLEVDWGDLVGPRALVPGERVMSFADAGKGGRSTKIRESSATVLHPVESARSLPLLIDVRARDMSDVGGLFGHRGEEFCYVLAGTLVLHMEGRPPRIMKAGASALFDSSTPHAYLSGSSAGTKILIVVNRGFAAPLPPPADAPAA